MARLAKIGVEGGAIIIIGLQKRRRIGNVESEALDSETAIRFRGMWGQWSRELSPCCTRQKRRWHHRSCDNFRRLASSRIRWIFRWNSFLFLESIHQVVGIDSTERKRSDDFSDSSYCENFRAIFKKKKYRFTKRTLFDLLWVILKVFWELDESEWWIYRFLIKKRLYFIK